MNTRNTTTATDKRVLLSTIWIFATLNYLYCDVLGLMDSQMLSQYVTGTVNGMEMTQGFLLGAAILIEIPIAMVLLSRVLGHGVNRWVNVISGAIMTVVQLMTLFVGHPTGYYLFCSVLEIAATTMVVWLAWTWRRAEGPA